MRRKTITDTVHPDILDRAKAARAEYNEHLDALRDSGYTRKTLVGGRDGDIVDASVPGGISLETAVLMAEAASIIKGVEELKE